MKKSSYLRLFFIFVEARLFPMVSCGGSENSPSHSDSPFQSSTNVSSEIDLEDYDLTTFELEAIVPYGGNHARAFCQENAEGDQGFCFIQSIKLFPCVVPTSR